MSIANDTLRVALESREVNTVTQALSELAEKLAYRLKPPYTEIIKVKAKEEGNNFAIRFSAKLHLHYASLRNQDEGLVFTLQFSGQALADSPNPPVDQLFAAGVMDAMSVYGYGRNWPGETIPTPNQLSEKLEVRSRTLNRISIDDLLRRMEA
jgi:hypothetical protein